MTIPEQKHCFKLCYHFKCLFHFCLFISGFSFWLPPKNKFCNIHVNYHRRWVGKAQHICFNDPVFFFPSFFLEKLWSPCRRKFFQLKFNDKKEEEEQNAKEKNKNKWKKWWKRLLPSKKLWAITGFILYMLKETRVYLSVLLCQSVFGWWGYNDPRSGRASDKCSTYKFRHLWAAARVSSCLFKITIIACSSKLLWQNYQISTQFVRFLTNYQWPWK